MNCEDGSGALGARPRAGRAWYPVGTHRRDSVRGRRPSRRRRDRDRTGPRRSHYQPWRRRLWTACYPASRQLYDLMIMGQDRGSVSIKARLDALNSRRFVRDQPAMRLRHRTDGTDRQHL